VSKSEINSTIGTKRHKKRCTKSSKNPQTVWRNRILRKCVFVKKEKRISVLFRYVVNACKGKDRKKLSKQGICNAMESKARGSLNFKCFRINALFYFGKVNFNQKIVQPI